METIIKQSNFEYQTRSLIDFLLGDGIQPGWLDEQSYGPSLSSARASSKGSKAHLVWHSS